MSTKIVDGVVIEDNTEEFKKIEKQEQDYDAEYGLKKLMDSYEIPTFVSLARVVGMEPQILYGKKNKSTRVYYYDRIAALLLRNAEKNGREFETIEDVVKAARAYLNEKEAKKKSKQNNKKQEPKVEYEFNPGDKVFYKTFRAADGVREYYNAIGTIEEFTQGGYKAKLKMEEDDKIKEITVSKLIPISLLEEEE